MSTLAHRQACHDGSFDPECAECAPTSTRTLVTQADLVLTRPDGRIETIRLGAFTAPYTLRLDLSDGVTERVTGTLDVGQWLREGARLLEQQAAALRVQADVADGPLE